MDYRRFGNTIFVRIDKDEEIQDQVRRVCEKEGVTLATVQALGAIRSFDVGVFHTDTKRYASNHFEGAFEITSLTGTITTKEGEYYAHLHMCAGDETGKVYGGHLNAAVVSATCELVLTCIDGKVERVLDEEVGLNLFSFQ